MSPGQFKRLQETNTNKSEILLPLDPMIGLNRGETAEGIKSNVSKSKVLFPVEAGPEFSSLFVSKSEPLGGI